MLPCGIELCSCNRCSNEIQEYVYISDKAMEEMMKALMAGMGGDGGEGGVSNLLVLNSPLSLTKYSTSFFRQKCRLLISKS